MFLDHRHTDQQLHIPNNGRPCTDCRQLRRALQINMRSLRTRGMTSFTVDYLLWHHFGNHVALNPLDMVRRYRAYFQRIPNPKNLAAFIETYLNRTPIAFSRDGLMGPKINVPVLQIVGSNSPFVESSVDVNSRLNPADSEWLKLSESSGLVLDDKPEGVAQAIILFLQGRGYVPTTNVQELVHKISIQSGFDAGDAGDDPITVLESISETNS
ncbi:unnamed protein product [Gongylonema pulchrum]|uniref:PSD1 domain-containing protein n=1 Tax=Gongylonema pulchrum TaxID=637853 RepID=A0A183DYC8_9BILA|nr:unnamed protein product [Gongylonema pulchrum]